MKKYLCIFLLNIMFSLLPFQASADPSAMSFTVSNIMNGDTPGTMTFTLDSCNNCIMSTWSDQFYFNHTPITGGAPGTPTMSFSLDGLGCMTNTSTSSYNSTYLTPVVSSWNYTSGCNVNYFTAHITVHNLKVSSSGWPGGNITCEWDPDGTGRRPCSSASIYVPAFQPTVPSCTVSTETLTVQMGDVQKTIFTGKGATSPDKGFNLSLHCNANTKVYTTVSGTADASNTQGVLALATGTGTATGVGVQIVYSNQPVQLGTLMHLQDVITESDISVPFQARYYQTGATVTGGQANSTATFTMTYQ